MAMGYELSNKGHSVLLHKLEEEDSKERWELVALVSLICHYESIYNLIILILESTAVPETREGDTPQDELALNSLPTSNDPEPANGEVTSKEDAINNEEEARSSNDSSITEPVPPLEYDEDNEEYLVVEDKKPEDELREEQTIISPLPSPYQTFPFSVDEPEPEPEQEPEPEPEPEQEPEPEPEQEPEPEPLVEEKSIEKLTEREEVPQEEATALEGTAKDESITGGELVPSSSLISYDIISEVDPKSYDASSKKVEVTKKSNGSNTNEEGKEKRTHTLLLALFLSLAIAVEQPEEQKYTSFKKDTMNNKRSTEDKYKTEVVTIENDEFVSVEYK